jgi:LPXTG-site transpeptidase (sortase) family protein
LPDGNYCLFVCGTTSIVDLAGNPLNGGTDYTFDFRVQVTPATLPATGFAPGHITTLPYQPASKAYTGTDLLLEIPALNQKMAIVGVPQTDDGWDVNWLGNSVGWLNGTAFPTWAGNTVLTGHVWDAYNRPGPFANLKTLKYGDEIKIHAFGQLYTYEVRESKLISSRNVKAVLQHEEYDWVSLLSCEYYNPLTGNYLFRRMVRAVLVSVK